MATGGKSQINASDVFHDFTCLPCLDGGKNTEAVFHCNDCQIFYCKRCVVGHNTFTKNHNVYDKMSKLFGQCNLQPKSLSSSELPMDVCEEHHGQVIQMFCRQHDIVCCTVCIAVEHRFCEGVEYIPKIAKGHLQDKRKTKMSLEEVKNDLRNLKSRMENELKEFKIQYDGVLGEIRTFKKRLIERVEDLEKKSVKELQERYKQIADDISVCCKNIDGILDDTEKRIDKLTHSENNNEAQSFVNIKYGERLFSDANAFLKQASSRKMGTLEFETNRSMETCLRQAQSLGKLTVWTTDDIVDAKPIRGDGKTSLTSMSSTVGIKGQKGRDKAQCGKSVEAQPLPMTCAPTNSTGSEMGRISIFPTTETKRGQYGCFDNFYAAGCQGPPISNYGVQQGLSTRSFSGPTQQKGFGTMPWNDFGGQQRQMFQQQQPQTREFYCSSTSVSSAAQRTADFSVAPKTEATDDPHFPYGRVYIP
ncbi:uncharacterized protein LOC128550686 isoform X2 [Mercenaria mercenaria]|uniref:uncharacterized protein LOC128550686 isoform X2 n=1 Tax=Mercenaria mercenaria TaxID=6596 RepID=UPI00234E423E|nr:uncharacterized protein LOC128550686 isoform X2 [Mercenaria mercenaria]